MLRARSVLFRNISTPQFASSACIARMPPPPELDSFKRLLDSGMLLCRFQVSQFDLPGLVRAVPVAISLRRVELDPLGEQRTMARRDLTDDARPSIGAIHILGRRLPDGSKGRPRPVVARGYPYAGPRLERLPHPLVDASVPDGLTLCCER